MRTIASIGFALLWTSGAGSESEARTPLVAPLPFSGEEIDGLVKDLDSPVFRVRKSAAIRLIQFGRHAQPVIQRALKNSPDLALNRLGNAILARIREKELARQPVQLAAICALGERIGKRGRFRRIDQKALRFRIERLRAVLAESKVGRIPGARFDFANLSDQPKEKFFFESRREWVIGRGFDLRLIECVVASDSVIRARMAEDAVIIAPGSVRISYARGCIILAGGDVKLSSASDCLVLCGGDLVLSGWANQCVFGSAGRIGFSTPGRNVIINSRNGVSRTRSLTAALFPVGQKDLKQGTTEFQVPGIALAVPPRKNALAKIATLIRTRPQGAGGVGYALFRLDNGLVCGIKRGQAVVDVKLNPVPRMSGWRILELGDDFAVFQHPKHGVCALDKKR